MHRSTTQGTGIRELRADLAARVRRAAAGEPTVITIGGTPVAMLQGFGADTAGHAYPAEDATFRRVTGSEVGADPAAQLATLVASGALIAPRRTDGVVASGSVPVWGTVRLDRLLREIRG